MSSPSNRPFEPGRRAEIVARRVAETAIDEAMIERLVRRFYGEVRRDEVLGPIFEARVSDWDEHLAKLCAFWSSIALMTGRYAGKPMQAHAGLGVEAGHFARWLSLFRAAAAETCPAPAAAFFIDRAETIAESLQLGIAFAEGRPPR